MRRSLFTILALLSVSGLSAQQKPTTTQKPAPAKGKNISITITPLKNCKVYLGSYFGKTMALVDSTMLNEKSQGVFKGPTKLTGGIYFVVSPQLTIQFELLMDAEQQFTIVADTAVKDKAVITGSFDNDLFKTYSAFTQVKGRTITQLETEYRAQKTKADSLRVSTEITNINKELQDNQDNIIKKNPKSLLAMLLNTMRRPTPPAIPIVKGKPDSLYPYRYVKDHFWDNVAFNDDRILRTPFFEKKIRRLF